MSPCGLQEQLFSVVEVLAKAASEEIKRRVEESCARIRVELSRSQSDIDHLKRKCSLMESELRKVRGRARRKVFLCGSTERAPVRSGADECRPGPQRDPEPSTQLLHQPVPNLDPRSNAVHPAVKVEGTSNELWRTDEAGPFTFEHRDHDPCERAHEAPPEPSAFTVRSHEDDPDHSGLHLKTEREEEEDDGERADASEAGPPGEPDPRSGAADRPVPVPCEFSGFSRNAVGNAGHEAVCTEDTRPGLYGPCDPSQPSWCRAIARDSVRAVPGDGPEHVAAPRESGAGPLFQAGALPGRGGLRRFRSPWVAGAGGERRFGCTYCARTFVRLGQLKEHLRSHTGERPYACAQCGRSFTKQGNLIRHAVVHSGEKPYQCSLCGKCFTQRSSMKSHQKTHLPDGGGPGRTHTGHFG